MTVRNLTVEFFVCRLRTVPIIVPTDYKYMETKR